VWLLTGCSTNDSNESRCIAAGNLLNINTLRLDIAVGNMLNINVEEIQAVRLLTDVQPMIEMRVGNESRCIAVGNLLNINTLILDIAVGNMLNINVEENQAVWLLTGCLTNAQHQCRRNSNSVVVYRMFNQ
jgi:hypothetical protein